MSYDHAHHEWVGRGFDLFAELYLILVKLELSGKIGITSSDIYSTIWELEIPT